MILPGLQILLQTSQPSAYVPDAYGRRPQRALLRWVSRASVDY